MNFFSTPTFLACLARAHRPGRAYRIETVRVGALGFDLLRVGTTRLVAPSFVDFLEPAPTAPEGAPRLRRLPAVCVDSVDVERWPSVARTAPATPPQAAPWIAWGRFARWDDFVHRAQARSSRAFRMRSSKLEGLRSLGALRFEHGGGTLALVDQCLAWKAAQYRSTGVPDILARRENRALFRELFAARLLQVSTLSVGERVVAIHLGAVHEGRFYYWIPAYDAELARYSPGLMLLENMLETSHAAGHREFDFLIGDEAYKLGYATDVRLVRPLGRPAAVERLWQPLRHRVMARVRQRAGLYRAVQAIKHEAVARGFVSP